VHRTIAGPGEPAAFRRLAASRDVLRMQVSALEGMLGEKRIELQQADAVLARNYSMVKDRSYHYDSNTRTLIEIVPLPVQRPGGAPDVRQMEGGR